MERTFAIGDIHGKWKALVEVLQKCSFDYNNDKLIVLGDIVDGGSESRECVEELLKIKNLIYIIGNHDKWFIDYIKSGIAPHIWLSQGGEATLESYKYDNYYHIPRTHKSFFDRGVYYYEYKSGTRTYLFVHGGFNPKIDIREQQPIILMWERELINKCRSAAKTKTDLKTIYDKIFIGHTSTQYIMQDKNSTLPLKFGKLWCLDTGGGWSGKLTIMDIETEEYWQSSIQTPQLTN